MNRMANRVIAAFGACLFSVGSAQAQTNGYQQISDSYTVQYPSNVTNVSERFTASNGLYTCWVYGTDLAASCCSGTGTRTEMRWETWPNQTVANQFSFDEMFSAETEETCIHQIKSDNKGDGSGGEAIYLQVNQPGTLRNSVDPNFASGVANTWFHINSIYDPYTGVAQLYFNGSLVVNGTYGPYPDGDWYFKTGVYDNGMPSNLEAWVQISNVVHLVQNFGFQLAATPGSETVTASNSTTYTVTMTTNSNFSGSAAFGVTGLPSGATGSFVPTTLSAPGNSTLTIATAANTAGGTYSLTIVGTNIVGTTSSYTVSTNVTLTVNGPVANPGVLSWSGASGVNTNWSTILNWTNFAAGGNGPPSATNSVMFTNLAAVSASALTAPGSGVVNPANINNFVDVSFAINGLTNYAYAASSSPIYHNTCIAGGATLSVAQLQVGGYTEFEFGDNNTVNLTISGAGGTLEVTNGAVIVSEDATNGPGNDALLDLSGLDTFTMDGTQIKLGVEGGGNLHHASGVVYLAKTNSLTLLTAGYNNNDGSGSPSSGNPALYLGHNGSDFGSGSKLYLGISNSLLMDYATIGRGDTNALLAFNPAFLSANPSVYIRGTNGGSTRVGVYVVGDGSSGAQANNAPSTNDFSGGTVDAMINYLCVGRGRQGNSSSVGGSGVLTLGQGTINANALAIGFTYPSGSNSPAIGTVNVNGFATLTVNSNLVLAQAANVPGQTVSPRGTLNINGGTVLANSIVAGGGGSAANLNSGTLIITNAAGAPGAAIGTFALTNSTLHLNLNGASVVTNIVVTNLIAGGVNTIAIDSVENVGGVAYFPLIAYNTFTGSVSNNFAQALLPSGFIAGLVNNSAQNRIDLVIAPSASVIPSIGAISLSGTNAIFSGSNGLPKGTYYVLAATNIALPLNQWTPILTNPFDTSGNFNFSNGVNPDLPAQFYLLQIP